MGMAPGGRSLLRARPRVKSKDATEDTGHSLMAFPSRTQSRGQRDPPPSLFLHPSPAASHVSLPGILAPGAIASGSHPLTRERSNLDVPSVGVGADNGQRPSRTLKSAESTRSTGRTDALWAEMQATLEEVELSASGGTHVFGQEHDRKLADLRTAQIALAQAWARSEADDAIETAYRDSVGSATGDQMGNMKGAIGETRSTEDATEAGKSTAPSNRTKPESSATGVQQLGAKLEEETEADILHARQRREANDEYFRRVNNGVIDVVAKLDDVAKAMRAVEQESKDVWNDNETASGTV